MDKIFDLIREERDRQENTIELIASENIVSKDVLRAQGSILTNKYAEGYPNKRYYGGCEVVDKIEQLAIDRACELFNCKFANVQPHSGSHANQIAYASVLEPGMKILAMDLSSGGHLTHSAPVSSVSKYYDVYTYGVNKETEQLDYNEILEIAEKVKPDLIICGASAYSRIINFMEFRNIADKVGALLLADVAHIAGLIVAGQHPSPFPYCDIVTTTTHKTLRGPRGGLILTNSEDLIKKINFTNFPFLSGGPLEHVIAAKAVAFNEALQPEFRVYIKQVVKNTNTMSKVFIRENFKVISGGTDNHLFLVDVTSEGVNGKEVQELLDSVNITLNKNSVPFEKLSPFKTSGVRIGTAAVTTRGFKEEDCELVAELIIRAIRNKGDEGILEEVRKEVRELLKRFPLNY